jgi:hypothetical protein
MNDVVHLILLQTPVLLQGQMLTEPIPQSFQLRKQLLVLAVLRTLLIEI